MKKALMMLMFAAGIAAMGFSGKALAVPTIDGILTSPTEWDPPLQTLVFDPNEVGIPDSRDMSRLLVKLEDSGGLDDGLYFRVDTYDTPTLTGGPGSGGTESFLRILVDFNGDGIGDRGLDFNNAFDPGTGKLGVYNSLFSLKFGEGTGAVFESPGGFYEFYYPESLYGLGNTADSSTRFSARLDDNGSNPDDFLPDTGFTHPLPEPGTLVLLGSGLISLLGIAKVKFFA